jgi:hypothetical protein
MPRHTGGEPDDPPTVTDTPHPDDPHAGSPPAGFLPRRLRPGEAEDLVERMSMFGMDGGPKVSALPASTEDAEALSAEDVWIRLNGETPLEFLVRVYRNPWLPMGQRQRAAESVMAFVHKQKARVLEGSDGQPLVPGVLRLSGLGSVDVRKLSDTDLDTLQGILERACVEADGAPRGAPRAEQRITENAVRGARDGSSAAHPSADPANPGPGARRRATPGAPRAAAAKRTVVTTTRRK